MSPNRTLRSRMLTAWAHAVTRRPWLTIVVCGVLSLLAVWYTKENLRFSGDRSALIDPSLAWQKRYAHYRAQFPRWDDAVVVVDRGIDEASRARAEAFIQRLEARLRDDARFGAVSAGFPRREAPAGMVLTRSETEISAIVEQLRQAAPVLTSPTLGALLGLSSLSGDRLGEEERAGMRGLLERAHAVAASGAPSVLGMDDPGAIERLITRTGRLATVLVSLNPARSGAGEDAGDGADEASRTEQAVNGKGEAIAALRGHIIDLRNDPALAGVDAGVTGVPVLESDETAQSMNDAERAALLSLGLIVVLMLIAYRGVVVPVLATIALLMGMAWSFAWATFAVGHLQVLSVVFASLLLGLGIDVAIHIIARLELVHADHDHLGHAIARAFRGVGPGILTASMTIAAASATMALTSFSGVAEMGIIAAGGIILCTISIMCVFPAMLMLIKRPEERIRSHDGGESRPYMGALGVAMHQKPAPILVASGVVMAIAGVLALGVRYDTDVQKLMPDTGESVQWQKRLEADDAKSVWHAVVLARNEEEARDRAIALRALPEVDSVGGAGMLFEDEAALARKQALLGTLPATTSMVEAPGDDGELSEVVSALRRACENIARRWQQNDAALSAAAAKVASLDDDALRRVQRAYAADRSALALRIESLRSAAPVHPDELPRALKELWIGRDGSLLLTVYPREEAAAASGGDKPQGGVLSAERLKPFARAVLGAAPEATGPTIQIFKSTTLITRAYAWAGVYAFLGILLLLILDFHRLGDSLCALLPVACGAVLMLAVMRVTGTDLNFANMIVLPLLAGIGVGCGVHAVRRWRLQPNDPPPGLAGGSGRAITLTTMTTVIGFVTMISAEHRGIRSLGFVMTVGLSMVWAATIFILPAVLRLRRTPSVVDVEEVEEDDAE